MQEGESLYSVAGQWRTNWLDVWSGNPHIKNPSTPPAYSALRMGPIYRAMHHDTVSVCEQQPLSMGFREQAAQGACGAAVSTF